MKKHLLKTILLLLCLITGRATSAWADDYSYTFDSKQFSSNNSTQALNGVSWTLGGDGGYWGYDGTKGQQFGSGSKPYKSLSLTTSGISGTITSIVVNASTASSASATISCTVGGSAFGTQSQSMSASAANYTFSGSASGEIVISMSQSTSKALYIKSISVTYSTAAASPLASIALSGTYPTTFHQGDVFSHEGMTVTATYEDESTKDVTSKVEFTGYDMATAGDQTVTVSYTENEVTKTAEYGITVNAPATLTSISLSGDYQTVFTEGDTFNHEGLVVTANYSDETATDVTDDVEFSTPDMDAVGPQTITVTYNEVSTTYDITINAIPSHNVNWSVNGETETESYKEGEAIVFFDDLVDINGKTFVGWATEAIEGTTDEAPGFVTSAIMEDEDVTFYAVFAYKSGSGSSEVVDELNKELTGVTGTSYTDWSDVKATSDAVYAGNSAGGNEAIQLRSNNNNSGIITTNSGGKVKKVTVTWNSSTAVGRTVNVYGKNSDYLKVSDLYNSSLQGTLLGTIVNGTSTELDIDDDYEYVGLRSSSGALYLDKVEITWSTGGGVSYSDYCTTVVADTKQDAELAFAVEEVNANISEQYEAPTLNTAEGFNGTVEYTSSDESVAMVMDTETGELRLLKEGTTTITATFAGNDDFRPGQASYTLTVTDDRIATTITVEDIVLDIADVATLTQLTPVVKDAEDNPIDCTYEEFPPKVSYEIVSDANGLIGSLDNNSGDITLNSVVGTATLKATYNAYNVNSAYKPSECTFTITVESTQTIAEARAQGTGSVNTKGIVTSCSGTTAYIQDATAAICVYGSELTVGDMVKVSGTLKTYSGLLEITSPTVTVLSQGNTVTPEVMTIADINASENQGWLVKIEGATVTAINGQNTTIAQDENTIVVRGISGVELAVNDVITLTGNIGFYNSAAQIANPTDVTKVELQPNTITVKQRYYYSGEYHYYEIPTDPQYQIDIVNFEHITFVVEANGATATAVSSDNSILEINAQEEANTFEAVGTGGSWEGQVVTVTFTTPNTSTYEAAERTITFLVKRPAAPTFSLDLGTYGETQYVELSTETGSTNYGFGDEYEPEIWYVTSDDDYDFENNDEPDQIIGHKYDGTPIEISKTTTIKAWTYRYDLNWSESSTATYVIDPTPTITVAETAIELEAAGAEGTIEVTYNNMPQDDFVAEVVYCDAEGNEASYEWLTASINEENNNIDYVVSENTSAEARTGYIKVYAIYDDEYYSDIISFTQAGIDYAILPFAWNGGTKEDLTSETGVSADGLGTNYAEGNAPYRVKLDGTGDYVQVKTDCQPVLVTIDVKMIGGKDTSKITVQESADGEEFTDVEELTISGAQNTVLYLQTSKAFKADTRYVRLYFTKGSNVGLGGITIEKAFDTVTIGAVGYTTYVTKHNVSFPAEVEAYIATRVNENQEYISLTQVTAAPKGTPVVLKNDEESGTHNYELAPAAATENVSDNLLKASDGSVVSDGTSIYALGVGKVAPNEGVVGFYVVKKDQAVPAGKAYLKISSSSGVNGFRFVFDEETGIQEIGQLDNIQYDNCYDLSGRRIQKPAKGLYIVNGKKVFIKK